MSMSAMILIRLTSSGPGGVGEAEHLAQRAVDAVPDADPPVGRLDVDVRRPVAQRLRHDLVDELDDRRLVGGADDGLDLLPRGVVCQNSLTLSSLVGQDAVVAC